MKVGIPSEKNWPGIFSGTSWEKIVRDTTIDEEKWAYWVFDYS